MRFLVASLLAPLLLAPVRLQDSTPAFFIPPAKGPAPESYSLPSAEPLTSPTVIFVSPTVLPQLPEISPAVVLSPSLNLPQPPLAPTPTVQPPQAGYLPPNLMSPTQAALCQRALLLVQDLSLLSYEQKRSPRVLKLSLAAATALPETRARHWPNLAAFNNAADSLPWFQPQRAEMKDAAAAVQTLCTLR